jgi:GTPase SAR1 family protein
MPSSTIVANQPPYANANTNTYPPIIYDRDLTVTIALVGNNHVGKSAMIRHYSANYRSDRGATVGHDLHCFALPLANFSEAEVYAQNFSEHYRNLLSSVNANASLSSTITTTKDIPTEPNSILIKFINSFPPNLLHVNIRDISGAECNSERMSSYLSNIDGALIVTDGETSSVRSVDGWRAAIQRYSPNIPCVLAWNKMDRYQTVSSSTNPTNVNNLNALNNSLFVSPSPSIMTPRHHVLKAFCKQANIVEYHLCSAAATNALSVTHAIEATISKALVFKLQSIEQALERLTPLLIKTISVDSSIDNEGITSMESYHSSSLLPSFSNRQPFSSPTPLDPILPSFSIFDVPSATT